MKEKKNWIKKAINPSHKGLLHKELNVKPTEKIPLDKLKKAEHSTDTGLKKRAVLADTLRKMKKK